MPPIDAPLSRATKIWFGLPAFAGAAMGTPIAIYLSKFYTDVALAPIAAVGIGVALARALDALVDPPLGWMSDRLRTPWGRRKPFIALGVPLAAASFWALFAPPATLSPAGAAAWFAVAFATYFFVNSIREVGHGAFGLELSRDYHERSSLFGIVAMFGALGTLVATFMPEVLAAAFGLDARAKFSTMAALYAVIFVLVNLPLLRWVPERPPRVHASESPFVPGVRRALRNRPFRILLFSGVLNAIPAAIPAVLMPYYTEYVLQPANPQLWLAILVFTFLGTGFLCLPLWVALARRIGKLPTLIVAGSIGTAGSILFFFVGPGDEWRVLAFEVLVGTQSQVGHVLIPAMAADVVDYDELRTGRRREAQFSAFWGLIPKLVAIPSAAIPLAVMGTLGYVPNQPQNPEVLLAIRLLFAVFPALFYIGALLVAARYPITERVHEDIRAALDAHARGEGARDPLTGAHLPPPGGGSIDDATGWLLDTFSPGELRRSARDGADRLARDVLVTIGGSAIVTIVTGAAAVQSMQTLAQGLDPNSSAGLTAVLYIVLAGLGLTATCLHALRLPAARRLAARRDGAGVIATYAAELPR